MERGIRHAETGDGASIAYWTMGDHGAWVLVIPSLGRGGQDFDELGQALTEAGYRVVAFDPRGIGSSVGPLEDFTLHTAAEDAYRLIECLGTGPVHVVGHAYGNRVARCLAADHPEVVMSVVLLAAGGLIQPEEKVRAALARCFQLDLPDEERLDAVRTAFFAPSSDATVWRDGWWPQAAAAQGAGARATPIEDWWGAGTAPLLVLQGVDDVTAPPANGHALKEQLGERVRAVDLQGAGHALLPEQPDAIAREIVAFLGEH